MTDRVPKHIDLFGLPQVAEFAAPVRLDFRSRKHDRPFRFGFAKALGDFALMVVRAFMLHIDRVETRTVNSIEVAYRKFLLSCLDFEHEFGVSLPKNAISVHQKFENYIDLWAAELRQSDLEDGTVNSYIKTVRNGVEILIRKGFIAPIKLPEGRRYPKVAYRKNITRLHRNIGAESLLKEAPSEIKIMFKELSFLKKFKSDKSISEYIELVIGRLRRLAEKCVREIWYDFVDTRRTIERGTFDVQRFHARYRRGSKWKRGFGEILADECNLVSYAAHEWGGVIDTGKMDSTIKRVIYKRHNLRNVRAKLHLVPESCIPFIVIILCETLMNVESCDNLTDSCLNPTLDPAEMCISWFKGRGRPRTIDSVVPNGVAEFLPREATTSITAPQAIRCLLEMRKPLIPYADAGEEESLFLVWLVSNARGGPRNHRHVAKLSISNLDVTFRDWLKIDPVLHTLGLRLDMIRGSIAIKEYIDSGGDLFRVQQLLDHMSIETTIRYIEDSLVDISSDESTRRVLEFIQVGVGKSQQALQDAIGLSDKDVADILEGARNIGFLGWTSRNSEIEADNEVRLSPFYQWLLGADIVVIESPEMAAELLALRDHLHEQRTHYHHQPAWVRRWAFLLAGTEMALQGFRKDIIKAGEKLRELLGITYLEVR